MFRDYLPMIMLIVGLGIGYVLTRTRKKETEAKEPVRKKERIDCDVVEMEEDRK